MQDINAGPVSTVLGVEIITIWLWKNSFSIPAHLSPLGLAACRALRRHRGIPSQLNHK
jgi:hypothetical protein